jgi:hypothetical protein
LGSVCLADWCFLWLQAFFMAFFGISPIENLKNKMWDLRVRHENRTLDDKKWEHTKLYKSNCTLITKMGQWQMTSHTG